MAVPLILAAATLCASVSAHDGDGVVCDGEKLRLANIDAPELEDSPRCEPRRRAQLATSKNPAWCDHTLGIAARDALRAFLRSGAVMVHRTGRLSYRRSVARVTVNGRDAGEYLIGRGLARRWID